VSKFCMRETAKKSFDDLVRGSWIRATVAAVWTRSMISCASGNV